MKTSRSPLIIALLLILPAVLWSTPALAQLQGGNSYPINGTQNPPTSFSTIANAVSYMTSSGVTGTGQIVLELSSGYAGESGPVTIPPITGLSSTLGVTFRSAAGYTALTAIAGTSSLPFAIAITGSYFTLDGQAGGGGGGRDWTIRCTGTGSSGYGRSAVRFGQSSPSANQTDVKVRYCILEGEAANTTSAIVGLEGGSTYTDKNFVVENSMIRSTGVSSTTCRGYGITFANASNSGNTGCIIRNNVIRDFYARGINLTGGFPGIQVYGNEIYHTAAVTQNSTAEFSGIYFSTTASQGAPIYSNFIHDIQLTNGTSAANGIYLFNGSSSGNRVKVYDNRVDIGAGIQPTTFPIYGIRDNSGSGYLFDIDYNSVYIGGSPNAGTYNSAAYRKEVSSAVNIRNNVFFNARSNSGTATGTHWGISINATTNIVTINNNDYYANGTGGVLGTTDGTTTGNKTTLAAWKAAVPADAASVSQNPNFLNATGSPPDLHLDTTIATQLESGGQVVSGIDNDFEGDIRWGSTGYSGTGAAPDIGADEFNGILLDQTPPIITYALLGNSASTTTVAFTNVTITDASGVNGLLGARPRVYYKKSTNANGWNDNTSATDGWKYAEANGSTSQFDFTIDYSRLYGGSVLPGDVVQYFVVAQDLASPPNVGINSGTFASQPSSVDLTAAAFPIGGTINSYTVLGQISGTKTVGTGGDYATLKAAFDALNANVISGPVTLTILASGTTETASAILNVLTYGAGGPFTITIKPDLGATPTITGSIVGAIVKLNGADYVTIDGSNTVGGTTRDLTISNTNTSAATAAIWLASLGNGAGATYDTVRNCVLLCGADQASLSVDTFGIIACGTSISTTTNGADNDNDIFTNLDIRKVRWGIYAIGAVSPNLDDNLSITRCTIGPAVLGSDQIGRGGVVIKYANQATISQNEIRNVAVVYANTGSGAKRMGIGLGSDTWTPSGTTVTNSTVTKNVIHDIIDEKTYTALGIIVAGQGSPSSNLIADNMLYNIRANGTAGDQCVGIGIGDGSGDKVVFNTIYMAGDLDPGSSGSSSQSACGIRVSSTTPTNLTLKDNIISIDLNSNTSSLHHFAIVVPSTGYAWGTGGENYNDYYPKAGNAQCILGGYGTSIPYTDVTTLAAWKALFTPNQDANSQSSDAPFVSATNLHLRTDVPTGLESGGVPIAGVTDDYDGDLRNVTTPDVGADEGNFMALNANDVAAVAFVNPPNNGTKIAGTTFGPQASFQNVGTAGQVDVPVRFRIVNPSAVEVYNQTSTIASMPLNGPPITVTFPDFTPADAGTYTMYGKAELPGDNNPTNDQIVGSFTVLAPLAGVYNVGAAQPAPFTTLTGAIGALNTVGIVGSVTFVLTDATYTTPAETFPIVINAYPGENPLYTVTIKPANPSTAITGSSTTGILVLNGADYVVIEGSSSESSSRDITITNTSTASATTCVWFSSLGAGAGATNDVVKNCILIGDVDQTSASADSFGLLASGTTVSSSSSGADNDNDSFLNLEVRKARWGIFVVGISGNPNDNNTISRCLVGPAAFGADEIGKGGIIVQYQNNVTVTQNEVRFVGLLYAQAGSGTDRVGIGVGGNSWTPVSTTITNSTISRNLVHDVVEEKTYSAVGIVVAGSGSPSGNLVANNMIYNIRANGTAGDQPVGLGIADGNGDKVVDNSILITGDLDPGSTTSASVSGAGILISATTPTNLILKDNIVSVDLTSNTTSLKHYAIVAPATTYAWGTGGLDFNDYYPNAGNPQMVLGGIGTGQPFTDVATLSAWRNQFTPAQDGSSMITSPPFVSATNLHLVNGTQTPLESGGLTIAGVTDDYDGDLRNATTPDIGADEFNGIAADFNPPAITYTLIGNSTGTTSLQFTNVVITDASGVDGTAGTRPRVYYKKSTNANTWNDNTSATDGWKYAEANGSTSPFDFTLDYSLIYGGPMAPGDVIQYFVVAQDLATPPNVGINSGIFAALPSSVALTSAAFPIGGTINSYAIVGSFAGTHTVGTVGGEFATLQAAFDKINLSVVNGDVTLTILASGTTETASAVLNAISYDGGPYSITIKPDVGATPAITGAITGAIIKLNGADRVVIDGSNTVGGTTRDLTISNTSTAAATAAVWLSSAAAGQGCTHDIVKNCVILCGADQSATSTETFGVFVSGTSISSTAAGGPDNDSNAFTNLDVRKVRFGIFLNGAAGNLNDNNTVSQCAIGPAAFGSDQIGKGGIIIQYQNEAAVGQNEVRCVGNVYADVASGTDRVGIGVGGFNWSPTATPVTNSTITRNRVHDVVDEKTWSAAGIVVGGQGAPSGNLIANNMIYAIRGDGTAGDQTVGIGISDGNGDKVVFNTIYLSGDIDPGSSSSSSVSACGIRIASTTPANLTLKDNIISIDLNSNTSSLHHYAIVAPATAYAWGSGGCDHNDYYPKKGNAQCILGGIGTSVPYTDVTTLAAWQTQFTPNQDASSLSVDAAFVAANDLHLRTDVPTRLESAATPIPGVTDDYDAQLRNATTPDVGCDEGDFLLPAANDIAAIAFINPPNGGTKIGGTPFTPQASFQNVGSADHTNVTVRFRIVDWQSTEIYNQASVVASMPGYGQPITVSFPDFTPVGAGNYTIYAKSELQDDENPANDQIVGTFSVQAPLAGVYMVGAAQQAPFNTLTNAVGVLNSVGIVGSVTFVLADSSYTTAETFPITLNAYPGENPAYSVTLKPSRAHTVVSGSSSSSVIILNGTDYVVIDGAINVGGSTRDLTIQNTSTSTLSAVVWGQSVGSDGASHDTIKNCNLLGSGNTYTLFGVGFGGTAIGTTSNGLGNRYNTIRNNSIAKTQYGVYSAGSSGSGKNVGTVIADNAINNAAPNNLTVGGILVRFEDGIEITRNQVGEINRADYSAFGISLGLQASGIMTATAGDSVTNAIITRNKVATIVAPSSTGWTAVGIAVAPVTTGTTLIANNMVSGVTSQATSPDYTCGIYTRCGTGSTTQIYYNSVYMSGDRGSAATMPSMALAIAGTDPVVDIRDNILMNTQTTTNTGKSYAIGLSYGTYVNFTSDFNDLYVTGSLGRVAVTGGWTNSPAGDLATLADWQNATGKDGNSISTDPLFVGLNDLHIDTTRPAVSPVAAAGTPLGGITTDFDGDTRSTPPDIGADEFLTYTISINIVGNGTVTNNPDYPRYNPGTRVVLAAHPALGWLFAGWSGDVQCQTNPIEVIMNGDKNATATFITPSDVRASDMVPVETFMAQSYPNPVQDRATIFWGLRESGPTKLQIFDVQGRLVRNIESGTITQGYKSNVWDGRDNGGRRVSAGFYVLRLQTTHKTINRRIIMIR